MERILPVYITVTGLLLAVILLALRHSEHISRNWAKVRVRIDDSSRRQRPESPEDEMESDCCTQERLIVTMFLLLLVLLLSGLR